MPWRFFTIKPLIFPLILNAVSMTRETCRIDIASRSAEGENARVSGCRSLLPTLNTYLSQERLHFTVLAANSPARIADVMMGYSGDFRSYMICHNHLSSIHAIPAITPRYLRVLRLFEAASAIMPMRCLYDSSRHMGLYAFFKGIIPRQLHATSSGA